jgi:hypothetical protein
MRNKRDPESEVRSLHSSQYIVTFYESGLQPR